MFTLLILLGLGGIAYGQGTEDMAVEVSATAQVTPPKITLHWKPIVYGSPSYSIFRKAKAATSWGGLMATVPAGDSVYADATVIADSAYEYMVATSGTLGATGYVYAGIKSPAMHNKGILLLLVDTTFTDSCAAGIKRLMQDISGDGWQIIRHDIGRSAADTVVKNIINADYSSHAGVKSLFILGHIAVPYSGNFDTILYPPDGHVPYHDGAWPSDVYYACPTGWTDVTVNNTLASYTANWNVPGDTKWDQVYMPSNAVLQVGRVDFWNMPSFAATEVQLMNSYLNKDHVYKMDSLVVRHRAALHDDFGYFGGEAFAANGWRNFAPLVSRDSLAVLPDNQLITTLASGSYQWAYGCGGGSFNSAGGIGATSDFAANPNYGIFTMLFGSYFGDWNVQDNFLRAPLCANPPALANCWAGRPNWFFHHMALGENIGYSAMLTQNNAGLYNPTGYGNTWIHVALMGDVTLRTDYIKPVTNLTIANPAHNGGILNWTASPDPGVLGYYVYRADSAYGYFQLISTMLTATTFHDVTGHNGLKYYMVRPVKLQTTPSGGYYNLGIGVADTAHITYASSLGVASVTPKVSMSLFPNPVQQYLNVAIESEDNAAITLTVTDAMGRALSAAARDLHAGRNTLGLNVSGYPAGVYFVTIRAGESSFVSKFVKE